MAETAALVSVQQSLRRCFDIIEKQHEEWKLAIKECDSIVVTLSNLAEQLQACKKVSFEKTPLKAFNDLKDRLFFKLEIAMDLTMEKLNDKLCTLQKVRDTVSHQVGSVLYIYEINMEKLGLDASLKRSPLSPSIADMLEWLQDIEKYYRNQYIKQKLILQLNHNRISEMQSLPHAWRDLESKSAAKQQLIQDTLLSVSLFREAAYEKD
ncbi:AFG2-interacting ribosome maturation factor isoform 2-T2 [Mantella aurantiaca]